MNKTITGNLTRMAAFGMVVAAGVLWASAPSAQNAGGQASITIDREGNVWHASGSVIRRCYFQEAGFRPVCSAWQ